MPTEPTAYALFVCIAFALAWALYGHIRDIKARRRSERIYRRMRDAA